MTKNMLNIFVTTFLCISIVFFTYFSEEQNKSVLFLSNTAFAKTPKIPHQHVKSTRDNVFSVENHLKKKFKVPKIEFKDSSGNLHSLKNFRDKHLIIYFWASWCMECIDELKMLNDMKVELEEGDVSDIEIIPVSVDYKKLGIYLEFMRKKRNR